MITNPSCQGSEGKEEVVKFQSNPGFEEEVGDMGGPGSGQQAPAGSGGTHSEVSYSHAYAQGTHQGH